MRRTVLKNQMINNYLEARVSKGMTWTTSRVRRTVLKINNYLDQEVKRMAKGHTASMHPEIIPQ